MADDPDERSFGDVLFSTDDRSTDDRSTDDRSQGGGQHAVAGRHRGRRTALLGLTGVLVLVAVVITLVSVLVDTTPGARVSPRTTAQAWAGAVVDGKSDHRRNLECSGGSRSGAIVDEVVAAATSAAAGPARRTGARRWSVPVTFFGPGGAQQASVPLTVIRQGRRYVVC